MKELQTVEVEYMMRRAGIVLAGIATMMLGSACTIQGDARLFPEQAAPDVGGDTVSFPEELRTVISTRCSGGGCHTDGQTTAGLNLDPGNEEANLVGVPSASDPSRTRVIPGDPENSLLMWRLRELQGTTIMPPGYAAEPGPLEEDHIVLFETWILGLEVTRPPDDVVEPPAPDVIEDVPDVPETVTPLNTVDEVFATHCTGCHVGGNGFAGLKLDADVYEENLVGVPSKKKPEILRVAPGDVDNSYLLWRLEKLHDESYMPPSGAIPTEHLTIVKDWILGLEPPPCEPQCTDKVCGDDGCGDVCGTCTGNDACTAEGQCVCEPQCTDKECGDDGCGDVCGTCEANETCDGANQCGCVPNCTNVDGTDKVCGEDGCGGSCGDCLAGELCEAESGQCVVDCTADCTDKNCGNDGCGGSCGECTLPDTCNTEGQCVCIPDCAGKACGDDGCGGQCGECTMPDTCDTAGQCVCVPDCAGKSCGDDGCGAECGTCAASEECDANDQCVALPQVPANVNAVFQTYCVDCHSSGYAENNLNLSEGFAYASIVGIPAANDPSVQRVKAGDPTNSYLMWRLNNEMSLGYMPPDYAGSPGPIPADKIALVSDWIAGLTPESN